VKEKPELKVNVARASAVKIRPKPKASAAKANVVEPLNGAVVCTVS
jgi:hypothetical protein